MKKVLFLLVFTPIVAFAQEMPGTSFDQMFEQMRQQMLRGMPGADTIALAPGQQHFRMSPDSSSYFYFQIDTTFSGSSSDFFQINPFGSSDPFGDLLNPGDMFRQMEEMQRLLWGQAPSAEPEEPNDGLLPEERLRLQESEMPPATAPLATPAKPAKPKIKTTRI